MDRLFLDANVLFSAAYRPGAGILRLWELDNVLLVSSEYAIEEARANVSKRDQQQGLSELTRRVVVVEPYANVRELPPDIQLPDKDAPIQFAAIAAKATHLLTGDLRHFGGYFGQKLGGVLVMPPGDYLRQKNG